MKGKKHLEKRKEDIPPSSEKKIHEKFEKIIAFIPDDENKKEATEILSEITISKFQSEMYSGPLPSADQMAQYENTLPGSANRIIAMAEMQNKHRREMEKIDLPVKHKQFKRGQYFSLIIGLFGLSITAVLALFGHDVVAAIIGSITISTILAAFIYERKK